MRAMTCSRRLFLLSCLAISVSAGVDGEWAWLSLDWRSGKTLGLYRGPSPRYNPAYIAMQLLPNGDPLYAGFSNSQVWSSAVRAIAGEGASLKRDSRRWRA